jgi:membrane protease YdiL (CAAX protease family)
VSKDEEQVPVTPYFGARAAGVILLAMLVSYIAADLFVVKILHHLQEENGIFSLQQQSLDEVGAIRAIILSALNPALILIVSFSLLRAYFPNESLMFIANRFGLKGRPPVNFIVVSFLGGVAYALFFLIVLMHFFPPNEFVASHPASVINSASVGGKLFFAIAAITIVPASEEFLFRGVFYSGLAQSWNKVASAILVSLAFILIHPDTIKSGYWLTHLALYTFPFVLILIREITGSLFGSIMMHSGFNFGVLVF